jgi:hypothetical protein
MSALDLPWSPVHDGPISGDFIARLARMATATTVPGLLWQLEADRAEASSR